MKEHPKRLLKDIRDGVHTTRFDELNEDSTFVSPPSSSLNPVSFSDNIVEIIRRAGLLLNLVNYYNFYHTHHRYSYHLCVGGGELFILL